MRKLLFTFVMLIALSSCTRQRDVFLEYFNPSRLPTQSFRIYTGRDTALLLENGTRVFIPAGAVKSARDMVTLEFKEALSMQQILDAGLLTQSNGKALSSGGMLYLGAAGGEKVSLVKPLKVSIPAAAPLPGMQLYKGAVTKEGINWTDPQPIIIPGNKILLQGRTLFADNCASCHKPLKDATGPALYATREHWGPSNEGRKEAYAFIRNPAAVIASGHAYAQCLYDTWNRTAMTAFPGLTDKELDAIYRYVDQEARDHLGSDTIKALQYGWDSCVHKLEALQEKKRQLQDLERGRRPFLVQKNTADDRSFPPPPPVPNAAAPLSLVTPDDMAANYYNIEINTLGWYNIDILVSGINGVRQSELLVRLTGTYSKNMRLLLVIPSYKILVAGGKASDDKFYAFKETNGRTPLPQGVDAFILAIGESEDRDQLYLGTAVFTTTGTQIIDVSVKETDSSKLLAAFKELQLDRLLISIRKDPDQPLRQELKQSIQELEATVAKGCQCYTWITDTVVYEEVSFERK